MIFYFGTYAAFFDGKARKNLSKLPIFANRHVGAQDNTRRVLLTINNKQDHIQLF